jgi:hypothetical protein
MIYLAQALRTIGPSIILAGVSLILLWRGRTIATVLSAMGFVAVALSQLIGTLVGFYWFDGQRDFAAATNRFGWTLPLTHWGVVLGLWGGSLGLLWHTLRVRNSGVS